MNLIGFFECLQVYFGLQIVLHYIGSVSTKRTMMGEPLNPGDFEAGGKMVISASIQSDMSIDDGTMDDIRPDKPSRSRINGGTIPWPNAIVPYLMDSEFSSNEKAMIANAVSIFHRLTCVRVKVRTDEDDYVVVKKNTASATCNSQVGYQGGRQSIVLAARCLLRPGSIVHEFMHALGFYHEQCREDRDNYITVFFDNIAPGAKGNFELRMTPGNDESPYDTLSITHYSKYAFSVDKKPTILPKKGQGELGQRKNLTKLDIQKINGFYNCNGQRESALKNMSNPSPQSPGIRGRCIDRDRAYCKLWSRLGHCSKSYMFMSVFCKATCKKCDMPCRDMNSNCKNWSRKKYCSKYSDYMNEYCQKSCGICV